MSPIFTTAYVLLSIVIVYPVPTFPDETTFPLESFTTIVLFVYFSLIVSTLVSGSQTKFESSNLNLSFFVVGVLGFEFESLEFTTCIYCSLESPLAI